MSVVSILVRAVLILALTAGILIVISATGLYLVATYSAVPTEFTCEGETRLGDGPPQKDAGRLRVDDYRWWVGLWSDSHGSATLSLP
jgi:hypothetical protein